MSNTDEDTLRKVVVGLGKLSTQIDFINNSVSQINDKVDLVIDSLATKSGEIDLLRDEIGRNKKKLGEFPIISRDSKKKSRNFLLRSLLGQTT